jgi:hypothetical protein
MITVLGSRPPPSNDSNNPPPPDVAPIKPPTPPSPPAPPNASATVADAPLLSLFDQAAASLGAAEVAIKHTDSRAALRGKEQGKVTITEEQVLNGTIDYASVPKTAESRLPERLQDWKGFIDPTTKKPYDYDTKVKDFTDFSPVGGGIHFGDKARLVSLIDLRHFVLTYDRTSKMLQLVGPSQEHFIYGPIDAQDLKALYRYAASDDNAAVSIGWSGEYVAEVELLDPKQKPLPEPVLLDPFFVDTRIGQDLVAADSLPWRLGEPTLPSGAQNPIAQEFNAAKDRFFGVQVAALTQFCRAVKPFTNPYGTQMAGAVARKTYLDLEGISLLSSSTLPLAKAAFLKNSEYEYLQQTIDLLETQLSSRSHLLQYPSLSSPQLFGVPSGKTELGDNKARAETERELQKMKETKTYLDDMAAEFDEAKTRLELLQHVAVAQVERPPVDSKWISVLVSVLKARKDIPDADLGRALGGALPTTTLAVLLDKPTEIHVQGDSIVLKGTMVYRYATSLVRVQGDSVVMSQGVGSKKTSVETIAELSDVVNRAMPTLLLDYAPLHRVTEEAQVVALLRWARKPGNILAVDFSSLSDVPGSDRGRTPTPDAIERAEE